MEGTAAWRSLAHANFNSASTAELAGGLCPWTKHLNLQGLCTLQGTSHNDEISEYRQCCEATSREGIGFYTIQCNWLATV